MTPTPKYHLIAGHNSGKRVSCKPELFPAFQNLRRAAQPGNYWATIAVREIESLSSGLEGKSNVYFKPGDKDQGSGTQRFAVFLPGLKATLVKWADGTIRINELELDGMYQETKQIKENTRMGLYRVDRSAGSGQDLWEATYEESGRASSKPGRVVAISDAGYANANHAANRVVPKMTSSLATREASIRNNGCDLHFEVVQ